VAFEAQASMLDAVILFFFFKVRMFILFYCFFKKRENICRSLVQILAINEWLKIKSSNFSSKKIYFNHKTLLEYQETDLSPNKPK